MFFQHPPKVATPEGVWKLKWGLCGPKEAARLWYDELSAEMIRKTVQTMTGDPMFFIFQTNDNVLGFIMMHVDDIIIGGTEDVIQRETEAAMKSCRVAQMAEVTRDIQDDPEGDPKQQSKD
jgi:hypothetical protein